MSDFTRIGGVVRPLWVGAVIDAFSRRVLAVGAVRGAPSSAFAVRLLREAIRRNGAPRWLVTDKDPVLRGGLVQRLLTHHGILRRYGAVGRRGSIALIERFWLEMKSEYVTRLFLYRPLVTIDRTLRRYVLWRNQERPHQGLEHRTPNGIYFGRRRRPKRSPARGTVHVGFLGGDKRLPVLRLRHAA